MFNKYTHHLLFALIVLALICSFYFSENWVNLCSGLALFLFGMQCMEDGLQQLAGSKLDKVLAKSTETPLKGLLFGTVATSILQSTTLVSLLTIAFINTGLISLAGGIAINLGTNLGATSGVWLLAFAGQSVSLSKFAYPMIVLGVLAAFNGKKSKAAGRILLGIGFIFLGIDLIKMGFSSFTEGFDFTQYQSMGLAGAFIFLTIGLTITIILQSSHATIMLVLTAVSLGQITLMQGFIICVGSKVGSAVTTGIIGYLSGNRNGQRLALAHVILNVVTGIITFVSIEPLSWLVQYLAQLVGFNSLIQIALFNTLFNVGGVCLFWFLQNQLIQLLCRWLPDQDKTKVFITELAPNTLEDNNLTNEEGISHAMYLSEQALASNEAAISSVVQELGHLEQISLEVICHAIYIPINQLSCVEIDHTLLNAAPPPKSLDADTLYRRYIKGIYGELLIFMGRMNIPEEDEQQQRIFNGCRIFTLHLVDAVKEAKHLQKNLSHYLKQPNSVVRDFYVELRTYILTNLREMYQLDNLIIPESQWSLKLEQIARASSTFEKNFHNRLFLAISQHQLDGSNTSSLMNDMNYASRIVESLLSILNLIHRNNDHKLFDYFKQASQTEKQLSFISKTLN